MEEPSQSTKESEMQYLGATSRMTEDVLFIIEDWDAKVGSQEIPGVTVKFGLGVQNEAGQRLTDLP